MDTLEKTPAAVVFDMDGLLLNTEVLAGRAVRLAETTQYKHLKGQTHPRTSITCEFPTDDGDPYYPIPARENAALYRRYEELAEHTPGVTFTGSLDAYRYYNMDHVVAQSLPLFARIAQDSSVPA